MLFIASEGKYFKEICTFYIIYKNHVYLVTERRLIHAKYSLKAYKLKWQVPYEGRKIYSLLLKFIEMAIVLKDFARVIIKLGDFSEFKKTKELQFNQPNFKCELPPQIIYYREYQIEMEPKYADALAE